MYALMIVFLSICIVGANSTMRKVSEVPELKVSEEVAAANLHTLALGIRCWAKANPGRSGGGPNFVSIRASSYQGVPCLHSSYALGFGHSAKDMPVHSAINDTHVVVYTKGVRLKGLPNPSSSVYQYAGSRYTTVGVLGLDGATITSAGGGVVGKLPAMPHADKVVPGAIVWVFNKN